MEDGALVIRALKETYTGPDKITRNYTSARPHPEKFYADVGAVRGAYQDSHGQRIWPAFLMLGKDIDTAGWPKCGEIDITENIGKETSIVHGILYGQVTPAGAA